MVRIFSILCLLLAVFAGSASAQELQMNKIRVTLEITLDSAAVGSVATPPSGTITLFSRGTLGVFYKLPNGDVRRVDSASTAGTADTARACYVATTVKDVDIVTMLPMFGGDIDSSMMTTSMKHYGGIHPDTVVIDSIKISAFGASCNVTPKFFFGPDQSASGTAVISSPSAVSTVNNTVTLSSFDNASVPTGSKLWCTWTDVTTKPWHFAWTVFGHYD
jgi:hypothetical protein